MNEALENLITRRSIKKYDPERQVTDGELDAVLEAGLYAPSGMNRQGAVMVAVRDKETRDLLSKLNAAVMGAEGDPFYGAPCVVVVLVEPSPTAIEDASLVLGNLMNAAHAIGLGSCWIHRAKQVFESPEGKALLKKWGLPENLVGVGHCVLGAAAEEREPKPRKEERIIKI